MSLEILEAQCKNTHHLTDLKKLYKIKNIIISNGNWNTSYQFLKIQSRKSDERPYNVVGMSVQLFDPSFYIDNFVLGYPFEATFFSYNFSGSIQ